MGKKAARSDRIVVEVRQIGEATYQLELVRCGKCRHCAREPVHGPYWYRYTWKKSKRPHGGRMVSTYVGKELRA